MSEHVNEWLSPYFDGELYGTRLRQVESHLVECDECRAELARMQELSALLRGTTPTGKFIATERFVSNLALNLPRQSEPQRPRKAFEIGWWLIPVGVLAIWAFLLVTFSLSSIVQTASDSGLLGSTFASLQGNPTQTQWFTTLTYLLGGQPSFITEAMLSSLNNTDQFIQNLLGQVFWQAILAVIYLGWLASWWFRQQSLNSHVQTGS